MKVCIGLERTPISSDAHVIHTRDTSHVAHVAQRSAYKWTAVPLNKWTAVPLILSIRTCVIFFRSTDDTRLEYTNEYVVHTLSILASVRKCQHAPLIFYHILAFSFLVFLERIAHASARLQTQKAEP